MPAVAASRAGGTRNGDGSYDGRVTSSEGIVLMGRNVTLGIGTLIIILIIVALVF